MSTQRTKTVGNYDNLDTYRVDPAFSCDLTPSDRNTAGDEYKPVKYSAVSSGSTLPEVDLPSEDDVVIGMVHNISPDGKVCRVQRSGFMAFLYTGSDPTINTMVKLTGSATAGKVKCVTPTLGAKQFEVVDVDTENSIVEVVC